MTNNLKANHVALGVGAVVAATTLYQLTKKDEGERTMLVFQDGGEKCAKTGGLECNAVSIRYRSDLTKVGFLKNALANALGIDSKKASEIRLWVQATKVEVTDGNLKSVLSTKHATSAVILISTEGNTKLSSEASSGKPLEEFTFTDSVLDLPKIGHKLAFKGKSYLWEINVYDNLFKGKSVKNALMHTPPYKDDLIAQDYPDIDYNPYKKYGMLMSVDPYMCEELNARQDDFPKMWSNAVERAIQDYADHGLFTNSSTDERWITAHGVLPKFFNAIRIKNYYPIVLEKTQTFVRQWVQLGNHAVIDDVDDWLTCMTADAVCKASMDYDMRNVERKGNNEELHPFIYAFRTCVSYLAGRADHKEHFGTAAVMNPFVDTHAMMKAKYEEQKQVSADIIAEITEKTRKGDIGGPLSFITGMLETKATTNGEYVHYEDFYGHCINLMVAGHETTAATLGFALAELVKNPDCMAKAMKEVQDVMGDRVSPTYKDVCELHYIEACFREAVRMYPAVRTLKRESAQDTIVLGNKLLRKGQRIQVINHGIHRDKKEWDQGVFGDPNKFEPMRWMPGAPARHPSAFCGFGFGLRSCIGMQFAILEAKTFLSMVLNFFTLELPPNFEITPKYGSSLAAQAKDLSFKLNHRIGGPLDRVNIFEHHFASTSAAQPASRIEKETRNTAVKKGGGKILILYGSNSGTCEDFAGLLAEKASEEGYSPEVMTLNQAIDKLPVTDSNVAIVTSTYNGTPPDNAGKFAKWLASAKEGSQEGMKFAVFGVGNSNWQATYQKFPNEVHRNLIDSGATPLKDLTTADVSDASFAESYDEWVTDIMGVIGLENGDTDTAKKASAKRKTYISILDPKSTREVPIADGEIIKEKIKDALVATGKGKGPFFQSCEVTKFVQLQSEDSNRSTCHVELALPTSEMNYEAGDHLEVVTSNNPGLITSALEVLGLNGDEPLMLNPGLCSFARGFPDDLPGIPITSRVAIKWLPNLAASPTRKVLNRLADEFCPCPPEAAGLRDLADEKNYQDKVLKMNLTLPEILSKYKSVSIDIEEFCASLPRLKPRFYSISSSPLVNPTRVSITVGLVEYDTKTGRHHRGQASGMINSLQVGNHVSARVKQLNGKFKLPKDPKAPIIMIGPGTGVAPFMGFLEERHELVNNGKSILSKDSGPLGPAHLFFGCRSSTTDYIYQKKLESYTKNGVLSADGLHVAFSREKDHAKVYVQDLILENGDKLWKLIGAGATVYICGDAKRMSPGVKAAFVDVAIKQGGMSPAEAESWMGEMTRDDRYLEDVYA